MKVYHTPPNSPNSSNLLSPFNPNDHSDIPPSPFHLDNNSHISSLNHSSLPTSFDHDNSSKSLSSLGLNNHLDVQDSLISSEFRQNNTFTVNCNFQSSTPIYFPITISPTPVFSPILPPSLRSPPRNSSPITLSLHPSITPQPLISVLVASSFQPSSLSQPLTFLPVTVQPSLSSVNITSLSQPSQNIHAKHLAIKMRLKAKLADLKEVANNSEQIDRVNVDDLQDTMEVKCMWVQKLSKADEHILLSGEWLNDTIVNASQRLIATSFPLCNGLQDTNLGQTVAFDIQRSPFVQVLHIGYGHWVTISTYGCDLGFVDIYEKSTSGML